MTIRPRHALILAGSRGPTDPVARAADLPHKALVPVAGVPMLERVVGTLFATNGIERIILCTDEALAEHGFGPVLSSAIDDGSIILAAPKPSPSESVGYVLDGLADDAAYPLLITTADHPLLTTTMVEHLIMSAPASDFVIGLAEASVIKTSYPEAIRTFYRFKGEGYSGCNLFLATTPKARRVVSFWQQMERHRKRPLRLVAAIGIFALLRFALGRLGIEEALSHLSRRVGAQIGRVNMPFAEAAIDVDKPGDLDLANAILKARA